MKPVSKKNPNDNIINAYKAPMFKPLIESLVKRLREDNPSVKFSLEFTSETSAVLYEYSEVKLVPINEIKKEYDKVMAEKMQEAPKRINTYTRKFTNESTLAPVDVVITKLEKPLTKLP